MRLVTFPHANGHTVTEKEFLEAWNWLHCCYGDPSVHPNTLPVLQSRNRLADLVAKEYQLSLEYLCRIVVRTPYRDTAQATNDFMNLNRHIIARTSEPVFNPGSGRFVSAVTLLPPYEIVSAEMERRFETTFDELGESEVLQEIAAGKATIEAPAPAGAGWRSPPDLVRSFVEHIARDRYVPVYRGNPLPGSPGILGWDARLNAYFWPRPAYNRHVTAKALAPMCAILQPLANAVHSDLSWSIADEIKACRVAEDVFKWGGVPQDPAMVTASNIRGVLEGALNDDRLSAAPMNSGWTKVAALATAHLANAHVIWDSRVSTSVIRRLDVLLPPAAGAMPAPYHELGMIPGRGGTRPLLRHTLSYPWPYGYGKWSAQVAGSEFVRCVRDELNTGKDPESDKPWTANPGSWTVRDVEMVLFMDGY